MGLHVVHSTFIGWLSPSFLTKQNVMIPAEPIDPLSLEKKFLNQVRSCELQDM